MVCFLIIITIIIIVIASSFFYHVFTYTSSHHASNNYDDNDDNVDTRLLRSWFWLIEWMYHCSKCNRSLHSSWHTPVWRRPVMMNRPLFSPLFAAICFWLPIFCFWTSSFFHFFFFHLFFFCNMKWCNIKWPFFLLTVNPSSILVWDWMFWVWIGAHLKCIRSEAKKQGETVVENVQVFFRL